MNSGSGSNNWEGFWFSLFHVFGEHWALDREDWLEDCLRQFLVFTLSCSILKAYLICQLPLPTQPRKWQGTLIICHPHAKKGVVILSPQVAVLTLCSHLQLCFGTSPASQSERQCSGLMVSAQIRKYLKTNPSDDKSDLEKIIPSLSELVAFKADQGHFQGIFLFLGCAWKSWFPDKGLSPWPLQWKLRVLATGPPGKPQGHFAVNSSLPVNDGRWECVQLAPTSMTAVWLVLSWSSCPSFLTLPLNATGKWHPF